MIIVNLMWSSDKPLVEVLKGIKDIPKILWNYCPYGELPEKVHFLQLLRSCGIVGVIQSSAPLHKMGIQFSYVFGTPGDPQLDRELEEFAKVLSTIKKMRGLRIGQIATRYEQMTGTYVDEFRMFEKLGITLVPISAHEMFDISGKISEAEVNSFIQNLKDNFEIVDVPERALYYAVRASMAVGRVVAEKELAAVAVQDFNDELHKLFKTRPQLWVPEFTEKGVVVGMEGDVSSTLALWIQRQLGDTTPMYVEILTFDQKENTILIGHASMHDPVLAGDNKIIVVRDFECEKTDEVEGAWLHFSAKPGPVTFANLYNDISNYRLTVFTGTALPVQEKLEGYTHALVKIDQPLGEFFKKIINLGMTQHFSVSYDRVESKIEKFCAMTHIDYVKI